jgi:hypothetical protein
MEEIFDSEDACLEILTLLMNGLAESEDEVQDIMDDCKTVVDIALKAVPAIRSIAEDVLSDSIRQLQFNRGGEVSQDSADIDDAEVSPVYDLEEFITICQSYAGGCKELRDMLREFEKSFLPLRQDILNASGYP